jgi:hypothetical protein
LRLVAQKAQASAGPHWLGGVVVKVAPRQVAHRGLRGGHIPSDDTRDLISGIEATPDTAMVHWTRCPGIAREEPEEKLLIEVFNWPVAAVQTLRLLAGHVVRADRASIKSAFVITHVQRARPAWRVQGRLEFGSTLSPSEWRRFTKALCHTYSDSERRGSISPNH